MTGICIRVKLMRLFCWGYSLLVVHYGIGSMSYSHLRDHISAYWKMDAHIRMLAESRSISGGTRSYAAFVNNAVCC